MKSDPAHRASVLRAVALICPKCGLDWQVPGTVWYRGWDGAWLGLAGGHLNSEGRVCNGGLLVAAPSDVRCAVCEEPVSLRMLPLKFGESTGTKRVIAD